MDNHSSFAYLPVPDTLIQLGLYVTGAGMAAVEPHSPYPQQQHPDLYHFAWNRGRVLPEYQFVMVSEGGGEFETKTTGIQKVTAGTVMLLFPDVWHRYRPSPETGWTEYWISINGDLMFDWQQRGLIRQEEPIWHLPESEEVVRQYEAAISDMTEDAQQASTLNAARALMVLASVIDLGSAQAANPPGRRHRDGPELDSVVTAALHEIWNHSHHRISVATIADGLSVSRRTLERRFSNQVGHSVLTEVLNCRIERARRLLQETQTPVKNVAFAAGFSSQSSFYKAFERVLNTTPSEYRMQSRSQMQRRSRS